MQAQSVLVLPFCEQSRQGRVNLGQLVVMLSQSVICHKESIRITVKTGREHEGVIVRPGKSNCKKNCSS